jgi:hypothetical protein
MFLVGSTNVWIFSDTGLNGQELFHFIPLFLFCGLLGGCIGARRGTFI